MLSRLSIRDIVFAAGLAVLTGETGAGKSILLDAFALALGARGDQALVRQGAEQGQVTAVFEVERGHPAHALLLAHNLANDIPAEDELILRRVQFADGRTRAFINDQPVSVQVMKELGTALVEIHGQHAEREGDWLRHAVDELGTLSPQAGEETALAERRTGMMQAEKVAEDLRDAHEVIAGANSSVPGLAGVIRRLERRASQAPSLVEPAVKALDAALTALEETRSHLEQALRTADFDPAELERIEERLFALRAAGRKYNVPGGELARFLLALKVVLADRGSAPTLVFDEIDTGVGGAMADAIGVRLAKLASGVQVLAVTHAPQVAARADRHYLISKDALEKGKRVATRVTEVAAERRREEIARMLAGAEITAEARAAAERLIKAAS